MEDMEVMVDMVVMADMEVTVVTAVDTGVDNSVSAFRSLSLWLNPLLSRTHTIIDSDAQPYPILALERMGSHAIYRLPKHRQPDLC
ncbi:unnamed protein product [Medioppia subpectinata]|uniref:Uncharacterized protein n=1 Tax=Medioppia subpectinata TaxID=1979941 RepID=A0A7R9QGG7_9ACAR|nr:unnamed protein product [Medioppia subpectinata]CAG2119918.1 unnamed protein product [Medioppia subpectinata]